MQTILYFAYGSNMSARRFAERVRSGEVIGTAVLHGYRFVFNKRGFDGSGKCGLIKTDGAPDRVYGVLYEMHASDLPQLDLAEGNGFGYERKTIEVNLSAGTRRFAECYFATDVLAEGMPYDWYRDHVLIGAREARLPDWYIADIASADSMYDADERRSARELSIYDSAPDVPAATS